MSTFYLYIFGKSETEDVMEPQGIVMWTIWSTKNMQELLHVWRYSILQFKMTDQYWAMKILVNCLEIFIHQRCVSMMTMVPTHLNIRHWNFYGSFLNTLGTSFWHNLVVFRVFINDWWINRQDIEATFDYLTSQENEVHVTQFEELSAITSYTKESIYTAIDAVLNKLHWNRDQLVAVATDGANAMIGSRIGFTTRLWNDQTSLVNVHCICSHV